jgi:hypothetical protein
MEGRIAVGLRRQNAGPFTVTVAVILAIAGCSGEELFRQPVCGFVILDGKPLAKGAIIFYPVRNNDLDIVCNGGAMINDGYFSLPRASGLVPGSYHAAIRAAEDQGSRHQDGRAPENDAAVAKEEIAERYNLFTELMIEINNKAIKEVTFHLDPQ